MLSSANVILFETSVKWVQNKKPIQIIFQIVWPCFCNIYLIDLIDNLYPLLKIMIGKPGLIDNNP